MLVGGCGSGRTTVLRRLAGRLGARGCLYVDAERGASTPEAFWRAVAAASPYTAGAVDRGAPTARAAFDNLLALLRDARLPDGSPAAFLIDGALEIQTFSSFPGLRKALAEFAATLCESPNRFALATRYASRAARLLAARDPRFQVLELPPLSPADVRQALLAAGVNSHAAEHGELTRLVHALTLGRPAYLRPLARALAVRGGGDPVALLAEQLGSGETLHQTCRVGYEVRLARARGHGSLKAILQILAAEEPLTLTAVAQRLGRTPGSTRDYLSWLEDVDLVRGDNRRYRYSDPLLRLWVRLHARPTPPDAAELARETHQYAVSRLPFMAAPPAAPPRRPVSRPRPRSIIEID